MRLPARGGRPEAIYKVTTARAPRLIAALDVK
jgi:hypothetical protein